ncbi:hypothetical protein E2C01_012544 [Portunus trituberculatus]|uniref:Uncharacterized protein n=1 Tax=Portunus trituberculatus TaxID=210409 RepID=A0A5B7DEE9_PORTR|nr:hypothetical protein [Portunus trituberculatus]
MTVPAPTEDASTKSNIQLTDCLNSGTLKATGTISDPNITEKTSLMKAYQRQFTQSGGFQLFSNT